MAAILTAAEMRAHEQAAIASGEVTGLELMERAGRGVVDSILAEWPDIEKGPRRAVVLCGPGNNGGDGFVVARLLRERGWEVEAFLYGDAEKLPPDAKMNYQRWAALGGIADLLDDEAVEAIYRSPQSPALVLDALFGIGLTRPLEKSLTSRLSLLEARVPTTFAKWVAVDVVSGVCSDSGRILGTDNAQWRPRPCDLIVTFHRAKVGHYLAEGGAPRVRVVDIGLVTKPKRPSLAGMASQMRDGMAELERRTKAGLPRFTPDEISAMVAMANRSFPDARIQTTLIEGPTEPLDKSEHPRGHKYSHGHALLLSGGCGRGGAARLAARGALRIGAGLVTLAVPPGALQENAARLDAIMLRSVKDAEALADLLADPRLNALCAGPGFGTGEREAAMLATLLDASRAPVESASAPTPAPTDKPETPPYEPSSATSDAKDSSQDSPLATSSARITAQKARPVVIDADALTLLARDPALRGKLHAACVLTPHGGEFARLFPAIAERLNAPATTGPAYSKVDAARDAARECGCTVLLKGADTVIASSDGRAAINAAVYDRAAPWLATAGSGDVLAGFITGLLARGFAPYEAACTAAWLHVEAARSFGPGLIAEDLPEQLPKVFRALGL